VAMSADAEANMKLLCFASLMIIAMAQQSMTVVISRQRPSNHKPTQHTITMGAITLTITTDGIIPIRTHGHYSPHQVWRYGRWHYY
jgi:hypothetical protein